MMTKVALVFYGVVGIGTVIAGFCIGHWDSATATLGAGSIWFGVLIFGRWAGGEWV